MGLTGFNRARRMNALKDEAKALGIEVDGLDEADARAKVDAAKVDEEPETEEKPDVDPEKVDGEVDEVDGLDEADAKPDQPAATKKELRAQADAIAEKLGIDKPVTRATVLDLQAFIKDHS